MSLGNFDYEEDQAAPSPDDLLTEAERRYTRAQYYHAILKEDLFNGDMSPVAEEVTVEIRTFIRQRLAVLLGVVQESGPTSGLSAEELTALKRVAGRAIREEQNVRSPDYVPTVRRVEPPPTATTTKKTAPKAAAKKETPKAPGETLEIVNEDGAKRVYSKHHFEDGSPFYLDENGGKFVLTKNSVGGSYMKSVQRQTVDPNHRPAPPLNAAAMAMVAAQHAKVMLSGNKIASDNLNTVLNTPTNGAHNE